MTALLVVSPHLDDAVLSVGRLLAGHPNATVATVCTAAKHKGATTGAPSTSYDRHSGFASGRQAMHVRRQEDKAACEILGVARMHLGLVDHQYGGSSLEQITEAVSEAVAVVRGRDLEAEVVMAGPVGIVHPDHQLTAEACRVLAGEVDELWLYEELPYRVLHPVETAAVLGRLDGLELGFLGDGPAELKDDAMACYQSQLWALDLAVCRMPERVWRWR